ncbi:hypothetical protein N0V83_005674 [Neocucurbitaria cava]|uniref:Uncharacterized protein n=1 Tax=Neocucurbitaria cava TaxID=798079 RepID=A0A9W9CM92_9PLEO|nr:hypothetical protein N0V83_005674 [Neocucurbitaria cava]
MPEVYFEACSTMETLSLSPSVERTADKRHRVSWMKRTVPLKSSALFNKAKHSEEWHQSVEATAGVLHPADSSKFPYGLLRNHTDVYLRKKGKISQADVDVRLAILIDVHQARDIGVAAAAHAMTAKSLRALLHAELNVAPGSYWGLETWLQCLIAANDGNPASVTDLEASWAHMLLPYATHGVFAAGWYLKGVSRALRKVNISNLNVLPEFLILLRRAVTDYGAQLEGLRLKCQWPEAYNAVFWMIELEGTSPAVTPPGHLLPEHIFDSQFPVWRLWAAWRPDLNRIARLSRSDSIRLSTIPHVMALDGPDVLTGTQRTLRDGLIAQYGSGKPWVRFGSLVIEVPDRTRDGLKNTLDRLAKALEAVSSGLPPHAGSKSMFTLFRGIVNQPITKEGLDIFEAAVKITYTPENDIYNSVHNLYLERDSLGGQHILALQNIVLTLEERQAEDLRGLLLCPWFLNGIEQCIGDCLVAVRTQLERHLPWTQFALEVHAFCSIVRDSTLDILETAPDLKTQLDSMPPVEQMRTILDIYTAAQSQRPTPPIQSNGRAVHLKSDDSNKQPSGGLDIARHPLEVDIEAFWILRLLKPGSITHSTQRTITTILHVWESTAEPQVDYDRRTLAILVSRNTGDDKILRCRCLTEIAQGNKLLQSPAFVKDLLDVMVQADSEPGRAIITFAMLLTDRNSTTQCWKDLLYKWLEQMTAGEMDQSAAVIEYSLRTMKAAEWLCFIRSLETLFTDRIWDTEERKFPSILQPRLLSWVTQVSRYTGTLTRLEAALGDHEAMRCILLCSEGFWKKNLLNLLESLERAEGKPAESLMHKVVGKLSATSKNDWEVTDCLFHLLKAEAEGIQVCEKIWNASQGFLEIPGLAVQSQAAERSASSRRSFVGKLVPIRSTISSQPNTSNRATPQSPPCAPTAGPLSKVDVPPSVAEVMVACCVQDDEVDALEKAAVEAVAMLLQIEVYHRTIPTGKLQEATLFWGNIEKDIIKEAERLETLQKALKIKDPQGTALLLEKLGIPDDSLLDEELLDLPADIVNVIERVGDREVELSFPLAAFTDLQRAAMGIPKAASTLLLRLSIDYSGDSPSSFCLHFNTDVDLDTLDHKPWICSEDSRLPQEHVCTSVPTAFTWQLNRLLYTELKVGNIALRDLHTFMSKILEGLGHSCISCGTSHKAGNAHLRRSIPCNFLTCAQLW